MGYRIKSIDKEYGAAEVERITGVSPELQRDWRRRGILAKLDQPGRAKYSLSDVIEIAALKTLADAGLPVSMAGDLAGLAILPVIDNFLRWPGVYEFTGHELSDAEKSEILARHVVGVTDDENWLYAALGRDEPIMGRTSDLRNLDGGLRGAKAAIIVDLTSLAAEITDRAALPLIKFQVEAS
jgi:hypothetical protein